MNLTALSVIGTSVSAVRRNERKLYRISTVTGSDSFVRATLVASFGYWVEIFVTSAAYIARKAENFMVVFEFAYDKRSRFFFPSRFLRNDRIPTSSALVSITLSTRLQRSTVQALVIVRTISTNLLGFTDSDSLPRLSPVSLYPASFDKLSAIRATSFPSSSLPISRNFLRRDDGAFLDPVATFGSLHIDPSFAASPLRFPQNPPARALPFPRRSSFHPALGRARRVVANDDRNS